MAARAGAGVADATALPFEDGSFGAAALLYVLYHLDAPGRALSERAACCGRAGSSPWRPRAATTRPSWRGYSCAAR